MSQARRPQNDALGALASLCRLGRSLGIHFVGATQRPDAGVLPGQIKANIPATVAFKVREPLNSRILLGEENASAASLPPVPGRGILQWQTETQFQAPWLSRVEAEELLERAYPSAVALLRRIGPGELRGSDGAAEVRLAGEESPPPAGDGSRDQEEVRTDA
jgi:DNA segregation ATPase FtsK/SpoIIIE-like protein